MRVRAGTGSGPARPARTVSRRHSAEREGGANPNLPECKSPSPGGQTGMVSGVLGIKMTSITCSSFWYIIRLNWWRNKGEFCIWVKLGFGQFWPKSATNWPDFGCKLSGSPSPSVWYATRPVYIAETWKSKFKHPRHIYLKQKWWRTMKNVQKINKNHIWERNEGRSHVSCGPRVQGAV